MNPPADTPVYNLKAVVRETGLKPDTIRAWERRYGLPEPQRTDSGHRLYSQNDVQMLKWLLVRQDEGMSISRAVVLWRQVQTNDPVAAVTVQNPVPALESMKGAAPSDRLTQLREGWINHCLHFDEQGAERLLSEAFALFPAETVCFDLIQLGVAQIGDDWHRGKVTVQQEHFASALATRRLEALISAAPAPIRTNRILIGCPQGEMHTLAPLLLTLWLRRRGWDVLSLGSDIPLVDMIATTRVVRPQLVILVAQLLPTAAALWEMAQLLSSEQIPLAYGGRIFAELPNLRLRIPGYYLGDHLNHATQQVENIMAVPRTQPATIQITHEYEEALHSFLAKQAEIEADVWRQISQLAQREEHLSRLNAHFSRNVIAALTLGDLNFLPLDLDWLLESPGILHKLNDEILATYVRTYKVAIDRHMGKHHAILSQWLDRAFAYNFADSVAIQVIKQ